MKHKLPNIKKSILAVLFLLVFFASNPLRIYAQPYTPTPTPDNRTNWVLDQEVTFVGKTANRANEFLQWTLSEENYRWVTLPQQGSVDPIRDFWVLVRNIVYAVLALFILGAAFVMMVTRGQNLTIVRLIPRFMMIAILIVFSFAIIRFIYQSTDVVQGFFLNVKDPDTQENRNIGPQDLLYVAFPYNDFLGYRQYGVEYDESAFISLLLVKLTAITYYVMTGLLLIRKIILWFFIVVSPIFPLLLFFRPVRNTAKIWIGEFFRWLLYAPLFALFLHGLVNVWRSSIPMSFMDINRTAPPTDGQAYFPTAISILLGGPGADVSMQNSVNNKDTFALYVVALIMLWVVILLPFLLLQIFLDYLNNVSLSESPVVKKITSNSWFNKAYGGPQPPSSGPSPQPAPFGLAKSLPFFNKRAMDIPAGAKAAVSTSATINRTASELERASLSSLETVRETKDIMRLANLSVPKMRDVARYETSLLKKDIVSRTEVSKFHDTLEKLSKPTLATLPQDRQKFSSIKEKLVVKQKQGDPLAASVMNATKVSTRSKTSNVSNVENISQTLTNIAHPERISDPAERSRITTIKQQLVEEKQKGNQFASTILDTSEKITNNTLSQKEKSDVLEKSIETLHDRAKEGDKIASQIIAEKKETISKEEMQLLINISNPEAVVDAGDRNKAISLRQELTSEQQKGNTTAAAVLESADIAANPNITQEKKEELLSKKIEMLHEKAKDGDRIASMIVPQKSDISVDITMDILIEIANPQDIADPAERTVMIQIKQQLEGEKQRGSQMASTVLDAAHTVSDPNISSERKEEVVQKTIEVLHARAKDADKLASQIITKAKEKNVKVHLPSQNKVQQVSIEEYEDVRKMWVENYQQMDSPVGPNGTPIDKTTFLEQDIEKIEETINLLSSENQENVDKGMDRVANILPFLLLGGFSKTEVVSYLKAKLEAAKQVISNLVTNKDEDTMLDRDDTTKEGHAELTMQKELPEDEPQAINNPQNPDILNRDIPANNDNPVNINPLNNEILPNNDDSNKS